MAFGLSFITNGLVAPVTGPYTISSVNLGADVSGGEVRYTVLSLSWLGEPATVCTIAGVSATILGQSLHSDGFTSSGLFIADTSGQGTSGNIVLTHTFSIPFNVGYAIYRLVDPASATPYASAFVNTHSSGVVTLSINVPTGGAAVGGISIRNNSAATVSWTGLTGDFEQDYGANDYHGGAQGTTAGSPLSITATSSDTTPQGMAGSSASWEPAAAAAGQPTWKRYGGVEFMGSRRTSQGARMW